MENVRTGFFHPTELGVSLFTFQPKSSWIDLRDLELRSAKGTVIPTEDIGIQDTERLMALYPIEDEPEPLFPDEEDAELEASIAHNLELLDQIEFDDELDFGASGDEPWQESSPLPRYQIQVHLVDDASVP